MSGPVRAEDEAAHLKRGADTPAGGGKRQKREEGLEKGASEATKSPAGPSAEPEQVAKDRPEEPSAEPVEEPAAKPSDEPATVDVDNRPVLEEVAHFPRRQLGSVVYEPGRLLVRGHELDYNGVLQVRVSKSFVEDNEAVGERRVWGTDVYTDDTDVVAALRHLGHLQRKSTSDLLVEVLLLPGLSRYRGSNRHGLQSRTWLKRHDGISYMVLNVREMPMGWATAQRDTLYERFRALQELRNWSAMDLVSK